MNATQGGKRRTEDELRQHAEARLRGDARPRDPAVEGTMQLVHELEVYQVELELQNEELRDTRDRLEQASRHYTELFDFAPIGYLMLDRNGVVTKANLAGAKLLATDRGTLTGARFGFFVSPTDRSRLDEYLQEVFGSDGRHTCELALEGDSQVTRIVRVEAVRVREQQTCRIVMLDISTLKHVERELIETNRLMQLARGRLEHVANYDALTDLPNRELLADRLRRAMSRARRNGRGLVVAYLDLDDFKPVNDQYGHAVGDEFLVALSARMKDGLRAGDTLARVGGDEFVALFVDMSRSEEYAEGLERLRRAASSPVTLGRLTLQVSASIGVTVFPNDDADADMLLRHADQAMYLAKQEGGNRYHLFDVEGDVAASAHLRILTEIRQALDRGEFELYYQPVVNLKTGQILGVEALIRWNHPERGLVLPDDFLPLFDKDAMAIELGEWVIDTALGQAGAWQAEGRTMNMSVNISAAQLQQPEFPARLAALLAAHPEVDPTTLELEILETSALKDIAETGLIMDACHALGVRFCLDDFGTGYSSLTYARRLPVDCLKIDRSFVLTMLDHPDDATIVEAVIALGGAFRHSVIAEGVETEEIGARLLELGCVLGQGFGIARPAPAAELSRRWA